MTYKRINKRTGEVKTGPWSVIADLDVRVWSYAEEVVAYLNKKPITHSESPYVVALGSVAVPAKSNFRGYIWRDIYTADDLVGMYI